MAMNQQWSLTELAAAVPLVMSGFAFAYVVGYFLAFDIAWFPFFSLSEHVVFALRALPIAVAASVCLLLAAKFPQYLKRAKWPWVGALAAAAVLALLFRYLALSLSFAIIAIATVAYETKPKVDMTLAGKFETNLSLPTMLFIVAQLMTMSVIVGFLSGRSWWVESYLYKHIPFALSRTMHLHLKPASGPNSTSFPVVSASLPVGHLIFVGNSGLLFYEYGLHEVKLYRWEEIEAIHESDSD
jgi:hypothetical protein